MELDNLIQGSYGIEDHIFAGHQYDRERALKALNVANKVGVGMEEFLQKHRTYLISKKCSKEHVEEQIKRIQNIDLYFNND